MMTSTFTRFKCWEDDRISKVINKEAISIDRKEFLVTHTPFDEIRVLKSPENQKVTNEESLLAELLARAQKGLHTFGVIQGVPGTGKSHFIRWLKERYAYQNLGDEVILIERSNSTLKGVLRQIIESKAFSAEQMKEQFDQLQKAFGRLSDHSIGDEFLNNLRIGILEKPISDQDNQISVEVRNHINKWLLDHNVRKWFMRKGGPVDRVRRHLAKDKGELGLQEYEHPGILPDDLLLDVETQANIEATYQVVREFTRLLSENQQLRISIAAYLDSLVDFAIGRSVSLSSEDLKTIFFDLRRNLLREGKSLTLFIEDITAFTGIDSGLVDVLVTQHTGEGNRAYCRVLSVIGITDSYFKDKFPDNLKSRIDIHLTLNSSDDSLAHSNLLVQPEVLKGMVARYLNAIRASDIEMNQWFALGAPLSNIPVRCSSCVFSEECFSAFGTAEVQMSQNGQKYKIGLYPFNERAIQTMFSNLDSKVIRTPRSLLSSVVEYVLHNHGKKIPDGEFPPAPRDLGGEFGPPEMIESLQRSALETQAGKNAKRILSLILFWGNKTIYTETMGKINTVGGLSEAVFWAFSLPMIQGQFRRGDQPQIPLPTEPKPTSFVSASQNVIPVPLQPVFNEKYEQYKKDISSWQDGGTLHYYDNYAEWVARFWRDGTQWADYGISTFQAQSRLTYGRVYFEGQAGEKKKSQIRFPRNAFIAYVLQALAQLENLTVPLNKLSEDQIGAISSILSEWKADYEFEVAKFVSGIAEQTPALFSIYGVSIFNNLMLNTVGGLFTHSNPDHNLVYESLISIACQKPDWSTVKNDKTRSAKWVELCNGISSDQTDRGRTNLLSLLNLPQGNSRPNVSFPNANNAVYVLDAQLALSFIKTFSELFEPEKLQSIPDIDDPIWNNELPLYLQIQDKFVPALQDQVQELKKELDTMQKYLGASTPQDVFDALGKVERAYHSVNQFYDGKQRSDFNGQQLQLLIANFEKLVNETRINHLALQLSASSNEIKRLVDYRTYLQGEYQRLYNNSKQLEEKLEKAPGGLNEIEEQRVLKLYTDIEQELENAIKTLSGGTK